MAALPLRGRAQSAPRPAHVGYPSVGSVRSNGAFLQALKDALRAKTQGITIPQSLLLRADEVIP